MNQKVKKNWFRHPSKKNDTKSSMIKKSLNLASPRFTAWASLIQNPNKFKMKRLRKSWDKKAMKIYLFVNNRTLRISVWNLIVLTSIQNLRASTRKLKSCLTTSSRLFGSIQSRRMSARVRMKTSSWSFYQIRSRRSIFALTRSNSKKHNKCAKNSKAYTSISNNRKTNRSKVSKRQNPTPSLQTALSSRIWNATSSTTYWSQI